MQQVEHGQPHRDEDPVEHTDPEDRGGRDHRDRRLGAPEPGDPPEPATSTSRSAAKTTTAPSAARGNRASSPPPTSSTTATSTSATSECSCVRLPCASPMAVRLPLLLTGNPRSSPAARFAAPSATSSGVPRTISPRVCRTPGR